MSKQQCNVVFDGERCPTMARTGDTCGFHLQELARGGITRVTQPKKRPCIGECGRATTREAGECLDCEYEREQAEWKARRVGA